MANFEEWLLMSSYRRLLKNNKEISWIRDLFADYVSEVLSQENKETFGKEDLSLFEWYFESLKPYHQVLQDEWIDCSIEMTEMFILWQSVEEFREFIGNENVKHLIKSWKVENIKLFFWEEFYNIKTVWNLKNLFRSSIWNDINDLILYWKQQNIRLFFWEKFYNIKNRTDLESWIYNLWRREIGGLISNWDIEIIELFFWEDFYDIKTRTDLESLMNNPKLFDIIMLITYWKVEFIRLLFWEDFYKTKTRKDFEFLISSPKWLEIINLITYWKVENLRLFFWKDWIIKTKEDLYNLMNNKNWNQIKYFILKWKISLEIIFKKYRINTLADLERNISLILQNIYVENDENLIIWEYEPQDRDFVVFTQKYKPQIDSDNSYLVWTWTPNFEQDWVFSLLSLQTWTHIIWEQEKWRKHIIWEQTFFDINKKKKNVTLEVQLAINRLFAPIFPMTRLLRLTNWKTNYVSVDVVDNEDWVELSQLKDSISPEINKFFIMIYQFLSLDYDRWWSHNVWKNFTIYDFDFLFHLKDNLNFFDWIFDNPALFEEMWEILYTLKYYLTSEIDILIPYYEKQWKSDVVLIFKKLRTRLEMLNFSNLIYFNEQVNPEVEEFARKVDSENYF